MFSKKDLIQLETKGIKISTIETQINNFKQGFSFAKLDRPAIQGDGIKVISKDELDSIIKFYNKAASNVKAIKFVPASGAASRMFKDLFSYLEATDDGAVNKSVSDIMTRIEKFSFFQDLAKQLEKNDLTIAELLASKKYHEIIEFLLTKKGLDYGNLPKGLIKFHKYQDTGRTSLEEHLVEASQYGRNSQGKASVHFTVSPEHLPKFKELVEKIKASYEKQLDTTFDISFSTQKSSTDTIAVDMNNDPFRENDNSLLFRPGGHGALIENLNDLDGDIIFIKNIDNIVPDRLKPTTTEYKKAIGGLLIQLQNKTYEYLKKINDGNHTNQIYDEISDFAKKELNVKFPDNFTDLSSQEKKDILFTKLNRPIRICGMVKNEGEPGGGPFWVKKNQDETSLQIVESSQVDQDNPIQKAILQSSTHFNPVDLVCGIKSYTGTKFNLHQFTDPDTGFISVKSKDGKDLKAQELPGLWNGAMADWITIFVEVPLSTFNPVKTINDLLRDQHQPA